MRRFARKRRTTSPPRAGMTAFTPVPATYAPPAPPCILQCAKPACRSGAAPAAVAPAAIRAAQQLADEESGEESRPAEWHEVAARPRPEIGRSAPVRDLPAAGQHLARGR